MYHSSFDCRNCNDNHSDCFSILYSLLHLNSIPGNCGMQICKIYIYLLVYLITLKCHTCHNSYLYRICQIFLIGILLYKNFIFISYVFICVRNTHWILLFTDAIFVYAPFPVPLNTSYEYPLTDLKLIFVSLLLSVVCLSVCNWGALILTGAANLCLYLYICSLIWILLTIRYVYFSGNNFHLYMYFFLLRVLLFVFAFSLFLYVIFSKFPLPFSKKPIRFCLSIWYYCSAAFALAAYAGVMLAKTKPISQHCCTFTFYVSCHITLLFSYTELSINFIILWFESQEKDIPNKKRQN